MTVAATVWYSKPARNWRSEVSSTFSRWISSSRAASMRSRSFSSRSVSLSMRSWSISVTAAAIDAMPDAVPSRAPWMGAKA